MCIELKINVSSLIFFFNEIMKKILFTVTNHHFIFHRSASVGGGICSLILFLKTFALALTSPLSWSSSRMMISSLSSLFSCSGGGSGMFPKTHMLCKRHTANEMCIECTRLVRMLLMIDHLIIV